MDTAAPDRFRFGRFALDTRRRVLLDEGRRIELPVKAYEALVVLVRNAGRLVERSQLMDEVWPGLIVDDNNLNQAVAALRRALGDDLITTVPRRGYQFVGEVRELTDLDDELNSPRDSGSRSEGARLPNWWISAAFGTFAIIVVGVIALINSDGPDGEAFSRGSGTESAEAQARFLQAQQARMIATLDDPLSDLPIELYDAAIEADPGFAAAWLGRSGYRVDRLIGALGRQDVPLDVDEEFELAARDAMKAQMLDPEFVDAHVGLAVMSRLQGDPESAALHMQRAIELDDENVSVLVIRVMFELMDMNRDEARRILKRLVEIHPNSFNPELLVFAGDIEGALKWGESFVRSQPNAAGGHILLGLTQVVARQPEAAERSLRLGEELLENPSLDDPIPYRATLVDKLLPVLIYAYGSLGLEEDASRAFEILMALTTEDIHRVPVTWMLAYLGIGRTDLAYEQAVLASADPLPPAPTNQYHFLLNTMDDPVLEQPGFLALRRQLSESRFWGD
jgi:DNA-binding winged helix-turn-helix (wHTH) protein